MKKKRTKNRILRDTKEERERSKIKVAHRNYRNPVGKVRGNSLKQKPEIPKEVSSC